MRLASLAMYVDPPALEAANDRFWSGIRDALRSEGVDAPDELDRRVRYDEAWLHPELLFAQTCGYPLVRSLRGRVTLVATPVYAFPGGRGAMRTSFVVVRSDDPATEIGDLRGRSVAVNEPESNSGVNLLRALVAPLSRNGRFFSAVAETGDHVVSLAVVRSGRADVAAIDSVTFGQAARFKPRTLDGLRILCETPYGPGLPFITRRDATAAEVSALRRALLAALADPTLAEARETIGLVGIEVLDEADYEVLLDYERVAVRHGYAVIA